MYREKMVTDTDRHDDEEPAESVCSLRGERRLGDKRGTIQWGEGEGRQLGENFNL